MKAERCGVSFDQISANFDDMTKKGRPELSNPNPGLLSETRAFSEFLSGEHIL